jgi:uncharacterized protein
MAQSGAAGKPEYSESRPLTIRIAGLPTGQYDFDFRSDSDSIGLDPRFGRDVRTTVRMEKSQSQIIVRAEVEAQADEKCDRCLAPFRQTITGSFTLVFIYDASAAGSFPPEEIRIIRPDESAVDITADVRDIVRLSEPLKLLCSEECRGLCSVCGTDLNVSSCSCPRERPSGVWKGLEKLR